MYYATPCKKVSLTGITNMLYCLNCLGRVLFDNKDSALSMLMLSYLIALSAYYWDGDMFAWVALLGGLYAVNSDCKHKTDAINMITLWWCGNMTLIVLLNTFLPREYLSEGEIFSLFGLDALTLTIDYLILAPFDFLMVFFIWDATKKLHHRLTIWHLVVCTYLTSNLYAHFSSCYYIFMGIDPSAVVFKYDGFMYASFYACLILLLVGTLTDRLIKHGGYRIDLDLDVRAFISSRVSAKRSNKQMG